MYRGFAGGYRPVDFVLHNSVFLVAHFHNVIIAAMCRDPGGTITGSRRRSASPRRTLSKVQLLVLIVGFYLAFTRSIAFGLDGNDPAAAAHRRPECTLAAGGGSRRGVFSVGILCQIAHSTFSIRTRETAAT